MNPEQPQRSVWDWISDLGKIITAVAEAKVKANAEREQVRAEEAAKSAEALRKLRPPVP